MYSIQNFTMKRKVLKYQLPIIALIKSKQMINASMRLGIQQRLNK